ncbi:MAG TPA: phosphopantetheine-binding protein [Burkholderiales bacterium]|jgi:acyl carrier protein
MLTEADVRKALKETIKSDKVESWSVDYNFRKAGALDSLDHVTFLLRLNENHGMQVPDHDVDKLTSIQAVLAYAAARGL